MTQDLENRPLSERFDLLLQTISSKPFLKMEGLGNEMPFFICEFDVEETARMYDAVKGLGVQLSQRGIKAKELNLYDMCLEIVQSEEDIWQALIEEESSFDKDQLMEDFLGLFDAESKLPSKIAEATSAEDIDVLFITGVGEVYPYVRTHALLENLPAYIGRFPLVMFFPGKYIQTLHSGAMLRLFDRLNDGKYYRAFNIFHYKPESGGMA
jgi:hypothetical protein